MALPTRPMVGLPSSPSFRYKALNPAYQSDPRRILGQSLMTQGSSSAPVKTPLQGLGRLSSALVGAYLQKGAVDRQVAREDAYKDSLTQALSGIDMSSTPILANFAQQFPEQALPIAISTEAKKATQKPSVTFSTLSASGVKALGLPTDKGQVYQINTRGEVKQVGGSGTTVNVGGKQGYGATLKTSEKLNEAAQTASKSNMQINTMLGLLNDETISTGTGTSFLNTLNKAGQIFNPKFKLENVAGVEAFSGFANQVILPKVKQLGSRPTDKDLEFVVDSYASLSNSVTGNKFLLEALSLSNARDVALAEEANKFIAANEKNLSSNALPFQLQTYLTEFTKTSPLFTEASNALKERFKSITGKDAETAKSNNAILNSFKSKGWIK
jgi:hypothetical protein